MPRPPAKTSRKNLSLAEMENIVVETRSTTMTTEREPRQVIRVFHLSDSDDNSLYHEILNNSLRYTIVDKKSTWDKEKGQPPKLVIALEYLDNFPE